MDAKRGPRPDGGDWAAVVLAVLALLVVWAGYDWIAAPPPPGHTPVRATAEVDGRGAAAFCALVLRRPDLSPDYGAAYANSGEPGYPLLTQLALKWGASGEPGAREQVALQCRRERLGS